MARAVIFVGPSLPQARSMSLDGVDIRPPAARGDIEAAAHGGAEVIGLIDGVFVQDLSVSPREIRIAAQRASIIGGASMGALRACDCPDAMQGVGEIYEKFRDGVLAGDDEVAVTFDPITYEIEAQPLVRLRRVVEIIRDRHAATGEQLDDFLARARELVFFERTIPRLREIAGPALWQALAPVLADPMSDTKGADARLVIEAVMRSTKQG